MSTITTTAYQDLYSLVELTLQEVSMNIEPEAVRAGIFQLESKPNHTGKFMRFEEFSTEQYAHGKAEGQSAHKFRSTTGYAIDVELQKAAENVLISEEGKDYDKYETLSMVVEAALESMMNRLDLDLQQRITFAHATSYVDMDGNTVDTTVGDGLALASASHTLLQSALTYRNTLAGNPQFSRGALEAIMKQWNENTLNHFGQKVSKKPNTIFSTDDPTTCSAIRELLNSTASVTSSNSGVTNVYKDEMKHVKLSRVATDAQGANDTTKAKYWGVLRAGRDGWQAKYAINKAPYMLPMGEIASLDADTDEYVFPVRMRYGIGVLSGSLLAISKGDGTA